MFAVWMVGAVDGGVFLLESTAHPPPIWSPPEKGLEPQKERATLMLVFFKPFSSFRI